MINEKSLKNFKEKFGGLNKSTTFASAFEKRFDLKLKM